MILREVNSETRSHRTQSKDYTAHLTYYDQLRLLSFVWDGRSEYIEICHGGYGEPTRWVIPAPILNCKPFEVVEIYEKHCRTVMDEYDDQYFENGPDQDGYTYHAIHPHCATMTKVNLPPVGSVIHGYESKKIYTGKVEDLLDDRWEN